MANPNDPPTDANLTGSGALAQGDHAQAVGQQGVSANNVGGSINTGTQIINNYLQGGQERDQASLEQHIISYLRWVQARCGHIELRGIERGGRKVLTLDLDKAYVPLQATITVPKEERAGLLGLLDKLRLTRPTLRGKSRDLVDEAQQIKGAVGLDEVLNMGNRLVVTGGPGCGKTTVLLHVAWVLATAILDGSDLAQEKLGLRRPLPLPIFIPLAAYARHLRDLKRQPPNPMVARDRTLSAFISRYLIGREHDFDLPTDFFTQMLRDGRSVMLLLDGLDEVSNEDERAVVRQAVDDLVNGRPEMRIIVTCRMAAYKGQSALGGDFREVVVTALDEDSIREMVARFYQCIYLDQPSQAEISANELMLGVAQLEKVRGQQQRLIDSPLMVRLLLIVHYNDRRMPQQRAQLFQKAAETMIQLDYLPDIEVSQELRTAVGKSWTDQYEMVQLLAYHMHKQNEAQGREIDEENLREAFNDTDYAEYVDALVNYTRNRGGLLEERMGVYRFIHLGFQEYLAARYVIEVKASAVGIESVARFFEDGLVLQSWWREPVLLIPGYCVANSKSALARTFLRRLAGITRKPDLPLLTPDAQLAAAEIAGSAALDLRDIDDKLRADLAARLATLYEQAQVMLNSTPPWRAAAGVALGRLGDPRLYAINVDDMSLCIIPVGSFYLGSAPDDKSASDAEKTLFPQHSIDYTYAIAQHPITNAQYNTFVQEDGYANPAWWLIAIQDGCWTPGKLQRRVFSIDDGKWSEVFETADKADDCGLPFNLPNHPVVGISWYEMLAFCEWLGTRWRTNGWLREDQRVVLPNEPEWEKSARGGILIPEHPVIVTAQHLPQVTPINQALLIRNALPTRTYPWGDTYIVGSANIDEIVRDIGPNYLASTSALGTYPQGVSPYGAQDMSGNIWEWTRSAWGPLRREKGRYRSELQYRYPYEPYDGRESVSAGREVARVLRGGSWGVNQDDARPSYRYKDLPDLRFINVGFRVVVPLVPVP